MLKEPAIALCLHTARGIYRWNQFSPAGLALPVYLAEEQGKHPPLQPSEGDLLYLK